MAYVKATDCNFGDEAVASRIQRIIDNQEDHEPRILAIEDSGGSLIKIGTFASPASTGAYAVTGVGFTPKLVKFTTTLTSGSNTFLLGGGGAMTASSQFAYAFGARGSLNGRHTRTASTAACLALLSISVGDVASDALLASRTSLDVDGFTINFSATGTGYTVQWEAYA